MPQVFSESEALAIKLILLGLVLVSAICIAVAMWRMTYAIDQGHYAPQPIPFSHKHHVGDDGLDCRYCHTSVEKARFAGMPSTQICLTCHSQLYKDAAMLAPLRESARTGEPLHWTRLHDLPDFVFFDHSIHVNKGVGCFECHGRIDQMPLTMRIAPLTMQWCLECHRNPAPHLHVPDRVFVMAPADAGDGHDLMRYYHIQSTRRLTDCSTCHR